MVSEPAIHYPPEILSRICAHVFSACLPPSSPSLDPLISGNHSAPTALPSSFPSANWPEQLSRRTLSILCLVDHAWYQAAKPWLWYKLEVRLPRSWLSLVEEIAWDYDEETVDMVMENTVKQAAIAALRSSSRMRGPPDSAATQKLEESIIVSISSPEQDIPDDSVPPELLSPILSREPSPRRFRTKSKSPARWELLRSISDAIQTVMDTSDPGIYIPTPHDPRPGRFVHHLDFNHFRTIGMRRSVEEGVNSRFVTGERVEAVLKELPNLTAFGATEYMDGALTLPVLNELLLRGAPSRGRGRPTRGRALVDGSETEQEDRDRRRQCSDLEALDLTGCVSAVFANALSEFVASHILPPDGGSSENLGKLLARVSIEDPLLFPGLRRLGMRGAKSILPHILTPFVLSFPSLTHLDLSGTRATPDLLYALGKSNMRLVSLALARCVRLTGESLRDLLVASPVTSQLTELNLYGDITFASPLSSEELDEIFSLAPCFLNGHLVYLDLSSAPVTSDHLTRCASFPKLRSLGLSHISSLPVKAIADFLLTKAMNVEVLTLIGTSPELDCGLRPVSGRRGSAMQSSVVLHTHLIRPLCSPPFSFSISASTSTSKPPPTRLRVIELSTVLLTALGTGAGNWRIIKSKGGRGWYVDTASGWIAENGPESVLKRNLTPEHPLRAEMERLSGCNGNVSSGVGWHARKMEILHGQGMLGREDGLYGAVSFGAIG
ncbi:hypothetical protein C8J56DRAFT_930140 [Mycena floridula]|nr:hypothetical protein C8J56DRAFT_930140 [Mycena floridula]